MTKKIFILGIVMSCLLLLSAAPTILADELETLGDPENDVYELDEESLATVEDFSDLETTSDKPNLDIKSAIYSKEDGAKEVTLTFEVYGEIEDSGINYDLLDADEVDDFDYSSLLDPIVSYMVSINTSGQAYTITYNNEVCKITRGDVFGTDIFGTDLGEGGENCIYEKDGSTLTFTFDLDDADETFVQMTAQSMYYDLASLFSSDEDSVSIEIYLDMAPNPLKVSADAPSKGKVGDTVKFSASTDEGTSPYKWEWDFDDDYEIDSTEQNPSYTYAQDGTYYPTVTVTDAEGKSGMRALTIEILSGSSNADNGNNGGSGNGLMVFIALILVVLMAGAAVLFYVLKR